MVAVTVDTNPAGQTFMVDGVSYSSAQTFNWVSGSTHTISTLSIQSGGAGTRYLWNGWSDGGAITHTVTPISSTTYTATYTTQYQLTVNAGTGGTVSPMSAFFNAGQNVSIEATPISGFTFTGWEGNGTGAYTGMNNPATVTMFGPITVTASFNPIQTPSPTPSPSPSPSPTPPSSVLLETQVVTPNGLGLRNALVRIAYSDGTTRTASTNQLGYAPFPDVPTGQILTVHVTSKRYRFVTMTVPVFDVISPITVIGVE
jgi:uncharacterized repeat protein (TIGR02543 family)